VVALTLPPLRERREDVPLLAEHFARRICEARGQPFRGIGRGALARLQAYSWPGNVRELEHAIDAALVVSGDGMVRREALPEKVLGDSLDEVRDLLQEEAGAASGGAGGPNAALAYSTGYLRPSDLLRPAGWVFLAAFVIFAAVAGIFWPVIDARP